jgi:hypothetical protein
MYIENRGHDCLKYPKLISGTFLSRVSFAEMFQNLSDDVRHTILRYNLLRKIARRTRGFWYSSRTKLFTGGYKNECGNKKVKGPTVAEWIEGFTRYSMSYYI